MEDKLEQLLNMLIQRGWKPFGEDIKQIVKNRLFLGYVSKTPVPLSTLECKFSWVLRELVSKESGLWQFVCENGMVEEESFQFIEDKEICTSDEWKCYYNDDGYPRDNYYTLDRTDAEFWIIESALKDESELEDFLLDNINV